MENVKKYAIMAKDAIVACATATWTALKWIKDAAVSTWTKMVEIYAKLKG